MGLELSDGERESSGFSSTASSTASQFLSDPLSTELSIDPIGKAVSATSLSGDVGTVEDCFTEGKPGVATFGPEVSLTGLWLGQSNF
jgi:hypothetical protein